MMLRLILAALLAFGTDATAKAERPNIVLLLTDDQDVLLGGIDRMPNLRRHLIESDGGTTFTNAYVHTPICCPSRSSILSGRYLHNGVTKNNSVSGNCNGRLWQEDAERKTFAIYAQKAGYATSYAGKYLNTYGCQDEDDPECTRVPPGWDKWFGLVGNSRYYNATIVNSDDGGRTARLIRHGNDYARDYLPDVLCNRTLDMIREFATKETKKKKPFLIVNSWPTPHGPFTPAPWAEHAFDGAKAPRTANWNASSQSIQQKHWLIRQLLPIDDDTEKFIDTTYQNRLEALLSVDDHIGQIVRLLQELGELDNTIIMYTSDHGFQLGQHRLSVDKRHLYEHDIKVPFIVLCSGRSLSAGSGVSSEIVLNIDIAPTIYELATGSRDIPESMDGSSFAPFLLGNQDHVSRQKIYWRQDFLISYHGEGYMPCGMTECPPDPHGDFMWMPDAWNNTYHCVRTISGKANSIYCRFEDSEDFVEYYDLIKDPQQLYNKNKDLSVWERESLETRLAELRTCMGSKCRQKSKDALVSGRTSRQIYR